MRILLLAAIIGPATLAAQTDVIGGRTPGGVNPDAKKEAGFSANIGVTTDFMFRGITLNEHKPAVQGGVDWTHDSGIYLGTWASNVSDPASNAKIENDFYGGYNHQISDAVTVGTGALYYAYVRGGAAGNTWEFPLNLNVDSLKLAASYSPHWGGGTSGRAWYYSSAYTLGVPFIGASATVGVGYSNFTPDLGASYWDFHVGFTRDVGFATVDLSGYAVNHQQFAGADEPRIVLSLLKTFP